MILPSRRESNGKTHKKTREADRESASTGPFLYAQGGRDSSSTLSPVWGWVKPRKALWRAK